VASVRKDGAERHHGAKLQRKPPARQRTSGVARLMDLDLRRRRAAARAPADAYTPRLCFALVVRYIAHQLLLDQRAWRRSWYRWKARADACARVRHRCALLLVGLDACHALVDVAQRTRALLQARGHAAKMNGHHLDGVGQT